MKAQPGKLKGMSKADETHVVAPSVVTTVLRQAGKATIQPAVPAPAIPKVRKIVSRHVTVATNESEPLLQAPTDKLKAALVGSIKPMTKVQPKDLVKTTISPATPTTVIAAPKLKRAPAPVASAKSVALPVALTNTAPVLAPTPVKVTKVAKVPKVAAPAKTAAPVVVVDAPVRAVAPLSTPVTVASMPTRAGRPSSRLAQLTVPSMAQSVASTAAKASYAQDKPMAHIAPLVATAVKKDPKLADNWKSKPVEQLTEAELIAMPDEEYMNDTQMAFFRLKLSKLKQEILNNAGETTEHLREETAVVPDPADRATIEEEHALELRTRDRERKLLKKIEQSIARISEGEYGYCDETGEPIGVGRLLARPTANLSLEAQQRRELKQKMFGD